jgi:hypothetical protein
MSIKYDFQQIDYPYGYSYKFGTWQGKYTVGDISIRGTRLWLKQSIAYSFDAEFYDDYDFHELLEKDEYEFPGDFFNLRADDPERFIAVLRDNANDMWRYISIDELDKYFEFFYDDSIIHMIKEKYKPEYHILACECDLRLWLIYDLNALINELEEILEKCLEEKITFTWV